MNFPKINKKILIALLLPTIVTIMVIIYELKVKYIKTEKKFKDQLNELNPAARSSFLKFFYEVDKLGFDIIFTSIYRPISEQDALSSENSSNAKAGLSKHNYGLAIDVNVVDRKTKRQYFKRDSKSDWEATGIPKLAKDLDLIWGGDFNSYHDPVHFSLEGYDTSELLARAKEEYGTALTGFEGNRMLV